MGFSVYTQAQFMFAMKQMHLTLKYMPMQAYCSPASFLNLS